MDRDASAQVLSHTLNETGDPKGAAIKQLSQLRGGDGSWLAQLSGNPFFTAGFGLAVLGAAARYGSRGLKRGGELLRKRLLVDLEITRHDESYDWVLKWMQIQYQNQLVPLNQGRDVRLVERLVRRVTPGLHHLQMNTAKWKSETGTERTAFSLVPGNGKHILRYKNAFLSINRERVGKSFDVNGRPFETIVFTTLYYHRHIFEDIFREAHEMSVQSTEGKTVIYTTRNIGWERSGQSKRKRPFDSVVLEKGLAEKIRDDVKEFLHARAWYLDRGIPYRRGYLLHGPPGTGKTSFVQALAGHLDFNIAMLSLSQRGLTDDLLNQLLLDVPARSIVLLEDADAAFTNRKQRDVDGYTGANVTYSGLLNALDGVASAEERIIFMTTNHIDRLDDALIRPGRVDMAVCLGCATEHQIGQLWDRFYSQLDTDGEGKRAFLIRAREEGLVNSISTAALQGLFLYNKDDVKGAISMVGQLVAMQPAQQKASAGHS